MLLGRLHQERAIIDLPVDRPTCHADERLQVGGRIDTFREKHGRTGRRLHRQRRLDWVKGGIAIGRRGRLLAERAVGDVGEPLPVVRKQFVPTGADVVGDRFADGLVDRGIVLRAQAGEAEELPRGLSSDTGKKFATRVGPAILHGAGHDERPGRDHRQQRVLVAGEFRFPVGIGRKGRAEPVREPLRDHADRLAEVAAREGRTATTRLIRNDHGEPFVAGTGPHRRLAQPRVADHDHLTGINLRQRDEPVENA